jgi:hypothetical protein
MPRFGLSDRQTIEIGVKGRTKTPPPATDAMTPLVGASANQ